LHRLVIPFGGSGVPRADSHGPNRGTGKAIDLAIIASRWEKGEVGAALAWLFLGEHLTQQAGVGVILAGVGTLIVQLRHRTGLMWSSATALGGLRSLPQVVKASSVSNGMNEPASEGKRRFGKLR